MDGVFFITGDIGRIAIERVGTPLMHIACHVIETQLVGCQQSDLTRRAMRIGLIPSHILQAVATGIEGVPAESTASGSILPLVRELKVVEIFASHGGLVDVIPPPTPPSLGGEFSLYWWLPYHPRPLVA